MLTSRRVDEVVQAASGRTSMLDKNQRVGGDAIGGGGGSGALGGGVVWGGGGGREGGRDSVVLQTAAVSFSNLREYSVSGVTCYLLCVD